MKLQNKKRYSVVTTTIMGAALILTGSESNQGETA